MFCKRTYEIEIDDIPHYDSGIPRSCHDILLVELQTSHTALVKMKKVEILENIINNNNNNYYVAQSYITFQVYVTNV